MTSSLFGLLVYIVTLSAGVNNPFSYSLLLVFLAVVSGLVLGGWVASWAFYCVVLIFLGGMMVMLLYISTFSSDPKIKINHTWGIALFLSSFLFPFFIPYSESWYGDKLEILGVYSFGGSSTMLAAVYLLCVLVFIVKLSESLKGSLVLTSL
uniref:NADH dehydrogenase subunit 6 n=1 Tax=Tigriopus japonicus TaxID=158387 RepID=Q1EDJ6_TIGJA|nr:NADH dehydrogenase subunit 6 [Tigriopus japonicus]